MPSAKTNPTITIDVTKSYKAKEAQALPNQLRHTLRMGEVVVMHGETRHTFEVVRKETTFAELKAKVAAKLGLTPSAFKLGYPEPWCYEPSPKHKLTHHDARVYIGDMLEVQVYE